MPRTEFRGPVLLTGAGREGQVGEAVARAFAERGAVLLLVDRNLDQARDRATSLTKAGFQAFAFACDLADNASVIELVSRVRRDHGDRVGALVHVAGGFAVSGPLAESDVELWHRMMSINLTTAFFVTHAFLPLVRAARGAIVYFASEAALPGAKVANVAAYAAAKNGVVTLMRAVAQEERDNGVRANALAPTSIRTAANVQAMGENVRYVEREEVAQAAAYLCSDDASAITGQLIALS
ncbi:MAG TPA: SDR family oxidoreductase [Gemmatimonadaceae bacterium]|jgi:NAD(P)-dependent dehydrogenase (short-subunit alcohol dehydrogenase family)